MYVDIAGEDYCSAGTRGRTQVNLVDAWVGGIARWFRASRPGCPGEMIRFRLRVPGRSLCSLHVGHASRAGRAALTSRTRPSCVPTWQSRRRTDAAQPIDSVNCRTLGLSASSAITCGRSSPNNAHSHCSAACSFHGR